MSVFDHIYYPFHHDHTVNTPLITPFELQMVGGVSHENWGVITPLGVWINPCSTDYSDFIQKFMSEPDRWSPDSS